MTTIHYSNQTEIGIEKVYISPLDFIKLLEEKTFDFDRYSTLAQLKKTPRMRIHRSDIQRGYLFGVNGLFYFRATKTSVRYAILQYDRSNTMIGVTILIDANAGCSGFFTSL